MKNVLITGANGFVGTNLVKELLTDEGLYIRAMVMENTPTKTLETLKNDHSDMEIVVANLLDMQSLRKATENIDIVVHLAGIVSDWASKELYEKVNVGGTKNLLNAAEQNRVRRVIFMSSLTVHALSGHRFDDENTPKDMQKMSYGVSKIRAENLVSQWAESVQGRDYAIVRPGFIIYGPYDRTSFVKALDAILSGAFALINKGKSLISYVYSENLAYGIHQLIGAPCVEGPYIILDGNLSWKNWVDTWCKAAQAKNIDFSVPYWLIAPFVFLMEKLFKFFGSKKGPPLTMYRISIPRRDLAFQNEKMKKQIGYLPPISFEKSVEKTLRYFRENKGKFGL